MSSCVTIIQSYRERVGREGKENNKRTGIEREDDVLNKDGSFFKNGLGLRDGDGLKVVFVGCDTFRDLGDQDAGVCVLGGVGSGHFCFVCVCGGGGEGGLFGWNRLWRAVLLIVCI